MNQVFTNKKNELTFTKNFTIILASTKLDALEKLIIARVLNWQESKLTCQLSNDAIAKELGMSKSQIKRAITDLNKLDFFDSSETSDYNEFGKWTNSKEMLIDEELLLNYIESDSPRVRPKSKKKIKEEVKVAEVELESTQKSNEPITQIVTKEIVKVKTKKQSKLTNKTTPDTSTVESKAESLAENIVGCSRSYDKVKIKFMVGEKLVDATPREKQKTTALVNKWYDELVKKHWLHPTKKEIETKAISVYSEIKSNTVDNDDTKDGPTESNASVVSNDNKEMTVVVVQDEIVVPNWNIVEDYKKPEWCR